MKPAKDLIDRIVHKYDFEAEQLPGQPLVEMLGNCRVIVENHCGITGYAPHEIRIRIKHGIYLVCGTGLKITQMTGSALVITGKIESVRFCGGQKA